MSRKPRSDNRYCLPDPLAVLTDEAIIAQIPRGSRVVDLGCGDGRLLARLRDEHSASIQGVELYLDSIVAAMERGVPVIQADLDRGLVGVADQTFDFAVLSQTLQQVRHPRGVLQEMLRVARQALVVVPNIAYWSSLPYEWYDTPNLHWVSMLDFRDLCEKVGATIVTEVPLLGGRPLAGRFFPNLRADGAMYVLSRT